MSELTSDQIQLLKDAKEAIGQLSTWKADKERLEAEAKKIFKKYQDAEKSMNSEIGSVTKKRRGEVEDSYDKELSKTQDQIKKVKSEREKAKTSGIKDRIEKETAGLVAENKDMKKSIKDVFRLENAPAICRSKTFFTLYDPDCLSEWLTDIALFLALCGVLPTALVLFLSSEKALSTPIIVLIYAAFIVVFMGIYVLGYITLKKPNIRAITRASEIRAHIRANEKQVNRITKRISKDKGEDRYGLQNYDYDLAKLEGQVEDINKKKTEALSAFDTATAKVISDEVTEKARPELEKLGIERDRIKEQLDDVTGKYNAHKAFMEQNYESVIGKDFMTKDKIDAIIDVLNNGNAASIASAVEFIRASK